MLTTRHRSPAQRLTDAYDRAAATWQSGIAKLGYPAAYAELFRAFPPGAGGRILDVGTGSGAFAAACLDAGARPCQLDLLDPSEPMLTAALHQLSGRAPIAAINAGVGTDLRLGPYDTLLCAHVLEHLDDTDQALAWLHEQLTPGGTLYLVASRPHWCTALLRWKWGHRAFRPAEMTRRLQQSGFAQVRSVAFTKGPPSRTSMGYIAERR